MIWLASAKIVLKKKSQFEGMNSRIVINRRCIRGKCLAVILYFISLHAIIDSRSEEKIYIKGNFQCSTRLETILRSRRLLFGIDTIFRGSHLWSCKEPQLILCK